MGLECVSRLEAAMGGVGFKAKLINSSKLELNVPVHLVWQPGSWAVDEDSEHRTAP